MNVVFFGDFDFSYPRETVLWRGLEQNNVDLQSCRISDSRWLTGWRKLVFLLPVYIMLFVRFFTKIKAPDVVFVPRNNHMLLPIAFIITRISSTKLVYDAFDPRHRTAVMKDRSRVAIGLLFLMEYLTLRLPDRLLVATEQFATLYASDYSLPMSRFATVPPGADQQRFSECDVSLSSDFTALYWGAFHPHHGVDIILEAAEMLSDSDIEILLIGSGMQRPHLVDIANRKELENVHFLGRLEDEELRERIAAAHVCFGIFSDHILAKCSITNKVFEAMAMGKPIITENSPATRELPEDSLYRIPPASPTALRDALLELYDDVTRREQLGRRGQEIFNKKYTEENIGARFHDVIRAEA